MDVGCSQQGPASSEPGLSISVLQLLAGAVQFTGVVEHDVSLNQSSVIAFWKSGG